MTELWKQDEVVKTVEVPTVDTDEVVQTASHTKDPEFVSRVETHEGFSLTPYKDSRGNETIGIGHLVKEGDDFGPTITEKQAREMFNRDLLEAERMAQSLPMYGRLNTARQQVLVEMVFNLGLNGVKGFRNTLKDIEKGNFEAASKRMLRSDWAKQVGQRAKKLAEIMRRGK